MKTPSILPVRVVLAFSLLVPAALGCARTSVDAITLARQAAGWHRLPASSALRLSGESQLLGVTGRFESLFAEGGRFRRAVSGPLARRVHFDGETLSRRPISSALQPVELYARESELLRAWVRSGYWLSTTAPVEISLIEAVPPTFAVRLLEGVITAHVELDPADHLARSLRLPDGSAELLIEFSDYRSVDGLQVAYGLRSELSTGQEWIQTVEEAKVVSSTEFKLEVVAEAADYSFDEAVPAAVPVVRARTGHLFVRALVEGQDMGLFLFDTGAGFSGLSDPASEALGLEAFGSTSVTGLGGGVRSVQLRRPELLQLGPLMIRDLVMQDGVNVERKEKLAGEKVAGVLGWDVMQRAVVELDGGSDEIVLHDPATYELPEGEWLPLTLHYQVPYVAARFEGGREGLFMLDSGAGSHSLLFFADATRRLGLLDGRKTLRGEGTGAGGDFGVETGTIESFSLAGDSFEQVPATFTTGDDGETDPYSVGLIGGEILGRYRLVFDYSGRRVAFLPRD